MIRRLFRLMLVASWTYFLSYGLLLLSLDLHTVPAITRTSLVEIWLASAVPAALSGLLLTGARLAERRRIARRLAGHCPACGYDLRATPRTCPECGAGRKCRTQSDECRVREGMWLALPIRRAADALVSCPAYVRWRNTAF